MGIGNGNGRSTAPQWVTWGIPSAITMVGAALTSFSVVTHYALPWPMYPLLGLMMGVLPAQYGNELLKGWRGGGGK